MRLSPKYILLTLIALFYAGIVAGQVDTSMNEIAIQRLSLEDMQHPVDSNRLKMISAGRINKSLDEVPLQVYVITEDEILRNQHRTLADVLLALPGIQVSRPGTGELGESFQIWNLTGNLYTKILINGIPVKPTVVAGMPLGAQLPIRQAERIEITYGNSSAVYGADAVSGVINIITREADQGSFVRGDIGLGAQGDNYINFTIGGKGGKNNNILQYSFYGSKSEQSIMKLDFSEEGLYNPLNYFATTGKPLQIGGETLEASQITDEALSSRGLTTEDFINTYYGEGYSGTLTMPDIESLGSEAHMLGLNLKYKGWRLSQNYMYRRTHSSLGLSPAFYRYNNPQNYWGDNINQFMLSYTRDFRNFRSVSQIHNVTYSMDNNSSQGLTQTDYYAKGYRYSASNDFEFNQTFSASPFENAEIVAGFSVSANGNLPTTNYMIRPFEPGWYTPYSSSVDTSYSNVTGNYGINPVNFSNSSAYLQFYYSRNKWRFLGGLRHDVNTLYGQRTSPQLAILHKTSRRTSLRLSLGTAYKAPPTSLTYQSLAYPVPGGVYVVAHPNESLRPEKFSTLELGLVSRISDRLTVEQTFFSYRITNHIVPVQFPSRYFDVQDIVNDSVGMWANYAESVSTVGGSQTTIRVTDIVKSIKLNLEAHLYFQARQDRIPNVAEFFERYISIAPSHVGKMKLSMQPTDNIYLYLESHWMSKWLRILIPFQELYDGIFGETDGYYAMNALASYNLSDQLNVYVKVTNLLDETYVGVNSASLEQSLLYNPQLRRTMSFGLSYRFN